MEGLDQLTMNWRSALTGLVMASSFTVLVFLWRRDIERRAVAWFSVFLIVANISAIPTLVGFAGAYDIWPQLTFLPTETAPLYGPLILIHAQAIMRQKTDCRLIWLLVPGLAYWLYQLWAFTMLGGVEEKWTFARQVHAPYVYPAMVVTAWVMLIGCLYKTWHMTRAYRIWLLENRSDDDLFRPVWLNHLLLIAAVSAAFWIATNIIAWWYSFSYFDSFIWNFLVLFALFILALEALAALTRPFPKQGLDTDNDKEKKETAGQSPRDWNLEGSRLKTQVLEQKWYLEESLSLDDLARRFGTNQTYLSRAINQGLGLNFSTFINGLRIEHAKEIIRKTDRSMISIAHETGFGSKASFNRAFKLHTGQSPSQFKTSSTTG